MNKFLTTLSVILSSFALAGCSHVSKVKTVDKFATIEVQGKSSKNKVYYDDQLGNKGSVKTDDGSFGIDLPRKKSTTTIEISANSNLSSAKKVSIPASKPINSWSDYVTTYDSKDYKLPDSFETLTSGTHSTTFNGVKVTYYLDNGDLMAIRITSKTASVKQFAKVVSDVSTGTDFNYDFVKETALRLGSTDKPVKTLNGKWGDYDSFRYHCSNVYGNLSFDIFK